MYLAHAGSSLDLQVVGYEFPAIERARYDSNWLLIRLTVQAPEGTWSATDPALLAWEAAELADWLAALARGEAVPPELSFLEPNLLFALGNPVAGHIVLRVGFWIEFLPPWLAERQDKERFWLELSALPARLAEAAAEWRTNLARFPERPGE